MMPEPVDPRWARVKPCPECAAGKCRNCDGTTWDEHTDSPTVCPCAHRNHEPEADWGKTRATCYYHGPVPKSEEMRQYAPEGRWTCFPCATSTPEREKVAQAAFMALVEGLPGPVALTDDGPQPFDPRMLGDTDGG